MKLKLLFIGFATVLCLYVQANGFADSLFFPANGSHPPAVKRSVKQLKDLEKILGEQDFQEVKGFDPTFFEGFNATHSTQAVIDNRKLAKSTMDEVEASNHYVDYLAPSDLNQLPIGIKKKVGNTSVTIAVSSAVFTPTYAELTVFARIKIPQNPKEIFFGVQGIKLSHQGGIIGDARLVLLGDLAIPIHGNNAALVLKGSMNMQTGQGGNLTYVEIDCNGFKKMGLAADIQFPRSLLIPVDTNGDALANGNVKGSFTTVVEDWNDITARVSFTPFQLVGLKGIAFQVSDALFDFSDKKNVGADGGAQVAFPAGYQERYLMQGNVNLWRGVYAKSITVTLPKAFKDRTTQGPVSFGVNDLIIDNNGITGDFFALNVLPIMKGTASGWKFSVDSIRLAIETNHLKRAGFGGRLGLPITAQNDFDTTKKGKFLGYQAVITASSDYVCRVTTLDSLSFDLWKASLNLLPNSYVQLTGNSDALKPEAMLHGSLSIMARGYGEGPDRPADRSPVADMKDIEFRSLHLTTEAPFISAQYFGYNGALKVANFPVSVDSISLTTGNNEVALGFNLKVNLHENEFGGKTRLNIVGNLTEGDGLQSWTYKKLTIEDITLNASFKRAFDLNGTIKFMNDDAIYGDGFKGHINATITAGAAQNLNVGVDILFGKKEFRYWYFEAEASGGPVVLPVGGGFNITGFSGGAYYRMKKVVPFNTSSTERVRYDPDSTAGVGLKAGVFFNWGSDKVAEGKASFEIAFNKGGGMRYAGMFGYVTVMEDLLPAGKDWAASINKTFKDIEAKAANVVDTATLNRMKIFQPTAASKDVIPIESDETPGGKGMKAYVGIQYDFTTRTLHGNFDIYMDAAGGLIKGAASNNRAGWAVIHIEPEKWYLHMGTPSDRLGIRFGIGGFSIATGSYFMVGDNIPKFPGPPDIVTSLLGDKKITSNRNDGELSEGKGLAFGTSINLNTGDLRFLMFYANFQAGLGFDVMVKNHGDAHCSGSQGRIGINGWYAEGQAYAYLQGELGVRVKVLFVQKNIPIIQGGAAALLQAKLPNPTYIGGYYALHVKVLGGLIDGDFRFKFTFGQDCQIEQDSVSEYDNFKVIASASPAHQSSDVSVVAQPRLTFSLKPNEVLEMNTEQGTERILPRMDYFRVVEGSTQVPGTVSMASDGMAMDFRPYDMLKPNTDYTIQARVVFQEYKYNTWTDIVQDGQRVEEVKAFSFRTGAGPDTIPHESIVKMYPFFNQRNLYKDEPRNGRIVLSGTLYSLFSNGTVYQAKFYSTGGQLVETTAVGYEPTSHILSYPLPANLATGSTYNVEIVVQGASGPVKPILKYQFTTSQYGTLAQKLQAIQMVQPVIGRVSSDIINLQAKVTPYEGFELYELVGNAYTGGPLIRGEALLTDSYYQDKIQKLLYQEIPLKGGNESFYINNRNTGELGAPPVKAIPLSSYYLSVLQSGTYNAYTRERFPYIYDLVSYYNRDFNDLRTQVINTYLGGSSQSYTTTCYMQPSREADTFQESPDSYDRPVYAAFSLMDADTYCETTLIQEHLTDIPSAFHELILNPFPFIYKGNYRVMFRLVLPDGTNGSTGEFTFQNPIE